MNIFLAADEVAELTGIRIGKKGRTREQLQEIELNKMHIPHYVNAGGRVIVVRAILEGRPADAHVPTEKEWEPV
ncbi:MAG: DUF4224 domain-containing protein [Xanthomonadaceae bacterium]|nr:DUF4224 domain-containing protein [Xanthomonadaceae bacterium]